MLLGWNSGSMSLLCRCKSWAAELLYEQSESASTSSGSCSDFCLRVKAALNPMQHPDAMLCGASPS